jgi:RNA polymerase sigma factor (sigma-70 family)
MVSESLSIDDVLPEVYRQLRGRIVRVLQMYRIPVEDAEDLIQTVLLLAVSKWSGIRDPKAWLIGTLQKRCILYWRWQMKQRRRFKPLDDATALLAAAPAQARWELLADLGAAARRLPTSQRRLVVLRFQLGLTPSEAAAAAGLAHSSVRKILSRGLAGLREQLSELRPQRPARPRRRPPAAWTAAVESWLGASSLTSQTRGQYRSHVAAAETSMGSPPLAELSPADLVAYRAALLEDGRAPGTHVCELVALRSFLLWALERGLHGVNAESLRTALRGWHLGERRRRAAPRATGTQGKAAAGGRDHGGGV